MNAAPTTATNEIERHEPHWVSRAAFPVISAALVLAEIAMIAALQRGWLWLSVPLVLVIGHLMHGQILGLHEASHGLLRKNRRLNEFDGILIGTFSFTSFTLYRVTHQTHHAHLSTERDEELWPFVFPGTPRWARMLAAFLELTAGLLFTPFLFIRSFLRCGSPIRSARVRRRIWLEIALIAVVWIGLLSAVAWGHAWKYFLGMYLVPAVIAADLQTWRKYIEHVGLTGRTVNGCTRSIVAGNWLGR
ncbi:MAG TPA: fatty acid desaturase, partial [Chthoniobacteraceae bacterium]|nr:fatty acid desaturase [Chthoniobacteraceae bacterium]